MLYFLDKAFFALHTLLMGFNMIGWAFRRTRPYHLVCLVLTAFSWFVLGAIYGWGYCICTDWHFEIRRKLGYDDPYSSYLQLLAHEFFGISMSHEVSQWLAGGGFGLIVIATALVWIREWRGHMKRKLDKS